MEEPEMSVVGATELRSSGDASVDPKSATGSKGDA
jgi:hypothetical protein